MPASNPTATLPASFDPFAQTITLLLQNGTPFNISMYDLDVYRSYGIRICINYSSQIGASFMLLVILFTLSKREKRRSPIFFLNALSLAANTIRSLLQCFYFTGPFYYPYAYFSGDYSKVPQSQIGISIAADTLTLILVIFIEISLILQVRVVCVTTRETQRFWIMVTSVTVAMVAIGFRFALVVINSEAIRNIENFGSWLWLVTATTITQAISIWFFSLVFLIKLGYALVLRRRLGLRQFGPMQIIFIMGCQTMVIPG
jgi:pheromone alpha factor receptor